MVKLRSRPKCVATKWQNGKSDKVIIEIAQICKIEADVRNDSDFRSEIEFTKNKMKQIVIIGKRIDAKISTSKLNGRTLVHLLAE